MTVDVSGLLRLANRQARALTTLTPQMVAVVAEGAQDVQRLAQQIAPNRTGTLARSIGIDFLDGGLLAVIGPDVDYDTFVEFGTNDTPAEPYMEPAGEAVLPRVNAELLRLARRAAR